MSKPHRNPVRPADAEAIALAKGLISQAKFGAIAVMHPETHRPHATRIAVATTPDGTPITLVSDLSIHTRALKADPLCSLLLGEPGPKGDPLTHPRITLSCEVTTTPKQSLRDHYLKQHPKAQLYIDFADFNILKFNILSADLNGGFGKAFHLTRADLGA